MNGRVVRFEGGIHHEAQRLLPWFVNGTLDDEEQALLEQHLGECSQCQAELAELREWQAVGAQPAAAPADVAQAWQRLRQRLPAPGSTRGHRWWNSAQQDWRQTSSWLRWTLVAQTAVLCGVALLSMPRSEPTPYRTLSTLSAPQHAANTLVIVFDPRASEAQLRRLLRASQARIVDGPNDAGAYTIAVPAGRLASVRDALRAAPGVTLVESLAPESEH